MPRTLVLNATALPPPAEAIARAAAVLRAGGLVAFPTETVYGLGADALNADAVAAIFTAKGRPAHNPLILHLAEIGQVPDVAAGWPDAARRLAARFWPGPLTLVLPRGPGVPTIVTAGGPTVAVRVPAHPVALALLRSAGRPVAAPSANRSTHLSPTSAEHVLAGLDGRIDVLLDGGSTPGGLESTVLDVTRSPPRLLRPGLIAPAELEAVIGTVERPTAEAAVEGEPLPAPGMLARHYAPRTPLELVAGPAGRRVAELRRECQRVGWLTFVGDEGLAAAGLVRVEMPGAAGAYAARLYAELHRLDRAGLDRIVVELPPEGDEWLAIHDRLRRAAAAG